LEQPGKPILTAREVIKRYGLRRHPEGGHFREVHRSARKLGVPAGYPAERVALTAIYFLLSSGECSAFHRVRSEEVWVHLAGAPLELVLLDRAPRTHLLTPAGGDGTPLVVVAPGRLQAAHTMGEWTLVTCFVAPGFDFDDFEMPSRDTLLRAYPAHADVVRRFTR
jgi:predicted cupin superfamily sugar epimerase